MDTRRVLIPLLLLASVLVDLAVFWPRRPGGNAALIALAALAGSQLSLAACYLVFGRAYVLWRVAVVALMLGAWSLAAGWAGVVDAPPAFAMGTIYLSIVGGHVCIVRLAGGRRSHDEDEIRADGRAIRWRLQFSLGEVYTAVTLMCVAMGAAVTFDWQVPPTLMGATIVWSGVMAMLTVGSLGVLRTERPRESFAATILLAFVLLIVLAASSVLIDESQFLRFSVASALATSLLVVSLMVFRIVRAAPHAASGIGKAASGGKRRLVRHVDQI